MYLKAGYRLCVSFSETVDPNFDSFIVDCLPELVPVPSLSDANMETVDTHAVHEHALKMLEVADYTLAYAPDIKLDGVYTMDQVTPEWLSQVLASQVQGAEVISANSLGGHEGMTSRHKWRLEWNSKGQQAGLPTAIFFKATPESPQLREMLSLLHMAELEAHVYSELQQDLNGLIPKAYYARSYPGGRFIIILEDLDEAGVTPHWMGDTCTIDHARAVAVAQAKIHSKFWNSPRFQQDLVWVRPRSRRFGELWLRKFFDGNRKAFLASDLGKSSPEYVRDFINKWNDNCVACYDYWDRKPQTIVHGDSHLGNTLGYTDGSAGYYDWQCLFRGYGYRDLSYFLMSALTSEDCKEHERDIFNLYTDTLEEHGVQVDRSEAWRDYCLLAVERFDSAMTSLTNGGYGHARHAFERQIRTISAALQDHDVSQLLDQVLRNGTI